MNRLLGIDPGVVSGGCAIVHHDVMARLDGAHE